MSPDKSRAGVDVYFERADTPPPVDPKVESLRNDFEETVFVMQSMQLTDVLFNDLFSSLLEGARVGLEGEIDASSLNAGANQLDKVRRNMVNVASIDRDNYLKGLTKTGAVVTALSLTIAVILAGVPLAISV